MPRPEPTLPDLVNFLKSFISPKQLETLIALLTGEPRKEIPISAEPVSIDQVPVVIQTPAGLDGILTEMSEAYSEVKFPSPSPEEARRIRDQYPGLIERLNAFQGRHLVQMLREKMK